MQQASNTTDQFGARRRSLRVTEILYVSERVSNSIYWLLKEDREPQKTKWREALREAFSPSCSNQYYLHVFEWIINHTNPVSIDKDG